MSNNNPAILDRAVCECRGKGVGMAAVSREVEIHLLLRRHGGRGVNGVRLVDV